jgi:hypothetical protein
MTTDRKGPELAQVVTIAKPYATIIDYLHELLEEARSGELRAIAIAAVYRDGMYGTRVAVAKDAAPLSMLGAVRMLEAEAMDIVDEQLLVEHEDTEGPDVS